MIELLVVMVIFLSYFVVLPILEFCVNVIKKKVDIKEVLNDQQKDGLPFEC